MPEALDLLFALGVVSTRTASVCARGSASLPEPDESGDQAACARRGGPPPELVSGVQRTLLRRNYERCS